MGYHSPICRLPTEILVEIIQTVRDTEVLSSPKWTFHMKWIELTWVCTVWRMVALEASFLWTSIIAFPQSDVEPLSAILERSRSQALTVNLDDLCCCERSLADYCVHFARWLFTFKPHTYRMRTLSLLYWDLVHFQDVQELLAKPLPNLTYLRVGQGDAVIPFGDIFAYMPRIPEHVLLLGPNISHLQTLLLDIPARAEPGQLTELKILYYHTNALILHRMSNLRALLTACPNLEVFRFVDDSPLPHMPHLPVTQPCHLPGTLRKLQFTSRGRDVGNLTKHFVVPPTTSLELVALRDWTPPTTPREARDVLIQNLPSGAERLTTIAQTRTLSLSVGPHSLLEGFYVFSPISRDGYVSRPSPIPNIICALPALISPYSLVNLHIHIRPDLCDRGTCIDWGFVLSAFPSVRRLIVGGIPVVNALTSAICDLVLVPNTCLPKVQELTICIAVPLTPPFGSVPITMDESSFDHTVSMWEMDSISIRTPCEVRKNSGVDYVSTLQLIDRLVGYAQPYMEAKVLYEDCGTCYLSATEQPA